MQLKERKFLNKKGKEIKMLEEIKLSEQEQFEMPIDKIEYFLRNRSAIMKYIKCQFQNQSDIIQSAEEMCSSDFMPSFPSEPILSEKTELRDVYDELEKYRKNFKNTVRECTQILNNLQVASGIIHRIYGCYSALPSIGFLQEFQVLDMNLMEDRSYESISLTNKITIRSKRTISAYKQRGLYVIKYLYESPYNLSDFYLSGFSDKLITLLMGLLQSRDTDVDEYSHIKDIMDKLLIGERK